MRDDDVQFPYRFLSEYLRDRGLGRLADLVPWNGNDPGSHPRRTKGFINILKIRLHFVFPDRTGTIARNEAHVRLMSSLWYASRALAWIGLFGMTVVGVLIAVDVAGGRADLVRSRVAMAIPSATVVILVLWMKTKIEGFLHYQRVREILYVLETAHLANQQDPSILADI